MARYIDADKAKDLCILKKYTAQAFDLHWLDCTDCPYADRCPYEEGNKR